MGALDGRVGGWAEWVCIDVDVGLRAGEGVKSEEGKMFGNREACVICDGIGMALRG